MTLLKFNGFEGYADPYDQRDASDFIASISRDNGMVYGTGRNGGNSLKYNNDVFSDCNIQMSFPNIDNSRIAICGFAFKVGDFGDCEDFIVFDRGDYSQGACLTLTPSGGLYIQAKAWGELDSVNYSINKNEWYYIEFKVKIHSSSGIVIVRINEQEVLNYSGDTYFSGGTTVDRFKFIARHNVFLELDDIYIADDQGTENNDFLGDIRIDAIHPSGAGNYSQMTPSAGSNYQCIDETQMDDTDYVEGANAGDKDSYTYENVSTDLDDSGIIGLQIRHNAKRTATSDNIKIDPFIRTGLTDYSQTEQSLPDEIGMVDGDIILDDPSDSNPWTQAKINACEFGVEVG